MIHNPKPQPVSQRGSIERRIFLGALAAGSIASIVPRPAAAADEIDQDKRKARYQESENVRTFYRVNRYP